MKRLIQTAFALTVVLHFNNAFGQSALCPPIGETIVAQDPEEVFNTFIGFDLIKDEFETTQEYEARVQEALAGQDLTSVAVRGIFDREYAVYDADNEVFNVASYAWDNTNINYSNVFPWGNEYGIEYLHNDNIDVVLNGSSRVVSQYIATTALGASRTVDVIESKSFAVFEGAGSLRAGVEDWEPSSVPVPISRNRARAYRTGLKAFVIYTPVFPFALGATSRTEATFTRPRDRTHSTNVLIGNISCVVITDIVNRVVASSVPGNRPNS